MSSMIHSPANARQPGNLISVSLCYALFMWAFSALVASLTLYFTSFKGINISQAYSLYAVYAALLWILPVLGGAASEKIGYLNASNIGVLICLTAFAFLYAHTQVFTFIGLSLFLIGNALFTPSLWCIVDHLYQKEDSRREAGFTLFYLLFNVGAVLGIFVSSFIHLRYNYHVEFLSCCLILVTAYLLLNHTGSKLMIAEGRTIMPQLNWTKRRIYTSTLTLCTALTPLVYLLFKYPVVDTWLVYFISIVTLLYLTKLGHKQAKAAIRHKVYGFIILCFFALGFWTLYNLEPSLLSVFIQSFVNQNIFGLHVTADAFFGFEALFIIIIGLILTRLWLYLAQKNKDPSLAIKFGMALVIMGLGFVYLYLITPSNGIRHSVPAIAIILSYTLFATGELFIGPLGISMVGKLAPEGKEGTLMGVWQLVVGIGAIASGWLANQSVVSQHSSIVMQQQAYASLFKNLSIIIILAGIVVLVVSPWVKRLLGD